MGTVITEPGPPRVEEVGDGAFAYVQPDGTWWINNTGFLVGQDGVISVDTCATRRRTLAYREAIAGVCDRPVRTVLNTHHHGDHTYGNYLFPEATIVAHEKTRAAVAEWGLPMDAPVWTEVDWGDVRLAPPFLTYTDAVTLWSGDVRCEARHVGTPAHTTNDSVLWLPDQRLLFAGDLLFNGGTPFLLMGSVSGSITVLRDVVRPLGARTIVPGHGPVAGPELIDTVLGYLEFVRDTAAAAHAAGIAPLDAARQTDLGGYAELGDSERIVGNLHRAYAELDGAEPGAPIDYLAALGDMITYNGGPLRTRA